MASSLNQDKIQELVKAQSKAKAKAKLDTLGGMEFSNKANNIDNANWKPSSTSRSTARASSSAGTTKTRASSSAGTGTRSATTQPRNKSTSTALGAEPVESATKKKKVGKIEVDETALESMQMTTQDPRARRNRLVIITLIVLILLMWAFIIVTSLMRGKKIEFSCHLNYLSDKNVATLTLNGEETQNWNPPKGGTRSLPSNTYQDIDVGVKFVEAGEYSVLFRIEVKNGEKLVSNFGTLDTAVQFTDATRDGKTWHSKNVTVSANEIVSLFTKIEFYTVEIDANLQGLTLDNMELNIFVIVEKV